jgi:hypothetical protein
MVPIENQRWTVFAGMQGLATPSSRSAATRASRVLRQADDKHDD